MSTKEVVLISGMLVGVTGVAIGFSTWWTHTKDVAQTSRQVLKVFKEQWPDKPFEVAVPPETTIVPSPSLFDKKPASPPSTLAPPSTSPSESLPSSPSKPEPSSMSPPSSATQPPSLPAPSSTPSPTSTHHDYCWPGHRVDYGRHWRCVYAHRN